ncbi:MAG: hypothetical protein GY711_20865 [bacterium]|nr:hypothetical protein [bacterium]
MDDGQDNLDEMLRWRSRCSSLLAITIVVGGAVSLLPGLHPRLFNGGLWFLFALVPLLAVATLVTVYYLARVSLTHGGSSYAIQHVGLALVLLPIGLIGALIVPLLVRSDVEKGIAEWRRSRS